MPVIIKAGNIKYKSEETGQYVGINSVSERAISEQIALIEAAGANQIEVIENEEAQYVDTAIDAKDEAIAAKNSAQEAAAQAQAALMQDVATVLPTLITNPDSPPLDRTLTQSAAAAPANLAGDLQDKINEIHNPVCNSIEKSKNLLAINPAFIGTVNGVTIGWSEDGEKITLNGTSTDIINIPVTGASKPEAILPAKTYTFTLSNLVGINSVSTLTVKYNYTVGGQTDTIVSHSNHQATVPFTDPANVFIQIASGKTYTDASFSLQIEEGETASEYVKPAGVADYTARKIMAETSDIILPSINSVEKSKNLLAINPAFIGTVNGVTIGRSVDGEKITLDGTATDNISIPVRGTSKLALNFKPGTYTFALSDLVGVNVNSPLSVRYNYGIGNTTTTIVNQSTDGRIKTEEFTKNANVFIRITSGTTFTNASFRLQIESGSAATSYQKPACMIDYDARGSIDKYLRVSDDLQANAASYAVSFERYQNIQYVDMMNSSGIEAMDSGKISADYRIRFRHMPFSIKCTTNASETYTRFRIPQSVAVPIAGTEEIELYLYTNDAASIGGSHVIRLTGVTSRFSRNIDTALQNGWNKIRIPTEGAGTIDYTTSETEWRLYVYSTAAATVWIGGIFAVKPDKANIIITDDGPYQSFYENAYPALAAIGVPVTWAGDWSKIGTSDKIITQEELNLLAYDGLSEFSFHNWDGTEQAEGTALTALRDTVNNIRYLQANGLQANKIWRAAWQGNNCAHPELANELVDASASHDGSTGVVQFPFPDRFNIPRWAMQGRNTSTVDTWFRKLERQHCTMMMYTHGISDGDKDVSEELLAYYVEKIEAGIQAGWLNATTYSRLVEHYRRLV